MSNQKELWTPQVIPCGLEIQFFSHSDLAKVKEFDIVILFRRVRNCILLAHPMTEAKKNVVFSEATISCPAVLWCLSVSKDTATPSVPNIKLPCKLLTRCSDNRTYL